MRLTVIGCGTAATNPVTPASGLLLTSGATELLLDCGPGVISRLGTHVNPTRLSAIVVSHLHFDHYLDLVALRYLLPWRGRRSNRPIVYLPPGGLAHLVALEVAMSERAGFFAAALDVVEYDPDQSIHLHDELAVSFSPSQHYVPSWSVAIEGPRGERVVYTGDTGPTEALVDLSRGADLAIVEASLAAADEDDPVRGHLTVDEAIGIVERSGARGGLIVHYPWERRAQIAARAARARALVRVAVPDLVIDIASGTAGGVTLGAAG
ncbi:MAG TPA: MBL fold metallo-hydrolase [Candidatus Limnocylindrales bacterium]|jgi:ribonuclease BN (tRNA processing enzyme)